MTIDDTRLERLCREQQAEIERLRAGLAAAAGYMENARIDLDTGAPKRTALATLEGGLKHVRAALEPSRALVSRAQGEDAD